MRILSRRPEITKTEEAYWPEIAPRPADLPWMPTAAAAARAERKLGHGLGVARDVLADLRATTDHLWFAPPAAVRPACQILDTSRAAEQLAAAAAPTVAERLAAIGLIYAPHPVTR